jgi:hypothetical protein
MGEYGLAVGVANEFTATPVPEDGGAQVWVGKPGEIAVPTNVQSNPEAHQVKLRWVPSEGAIQYRIIRFTQPETLAITPATAPEPEAVGFTTEHFFIDTTVASGKTYQYSILADIGTGVSNLMDPQCQIGAVAEDYFIFTQGNFTYNRATRQFTQKLTIINYSATLMAPVSIVLEGLTPDVTLVNQAGRAENGSPIIYAPKIPGDGGSVQISLKFNNSKFEQIKYVPFVVWGGQTP